MAEYQSIFTGLEVDNALSKLRSWIAADATTKPSDGSNTNISTVTISGETYAVLWKVAPTASNEVYGLGLHSTSGRIYQIHWDGPHSTYEALSLDTNSDTQYTAGAGASNSKLFLVGAQSQDTGRTYSNANVFEQAGSLYANSVFIGSGEAGSNTRKELASQEWVTNQGFTKNVGTITGITMNGASVGTSGNVNLGDVVTGGTTKYAHPTFSSTFTVPQTATAAASAAKAAHKHAISVAFKSATTTAGLDSATSADNVKYLEKITPSTLRMTASFSGTQVSTDDSNALINSNKVSVATGSHKHSFQASGTVALSASTNQNDGPVYVESVTYTAPTESTTSVAASDHGHGYTPSGTIDLDPNTSSTKNSSNQNSTGVQFVQSVTLPTIKTTVDVAAQAHTHTYSKANGVTISSGTTGDVTYVTGITGSEASGTPTLNYLKFTAGTTPPSSATPNYSDVNTESDAGDGTAVASTVHRHSYTTYSLTGSNSSHTQKYMKFTAGTTPPSSATPGNESKNTGANSGTNFDAVTGYPNFSGGSSGGKYMHWSAGTTPASSASWTGTKTNALVTAVGWHGTNTKVLYGSRTTSGSGATARRTLEVKAYDLSVTKGDYTPAGSVTLNAGTAPSLTFNTTADGGEYYLNSHTNASLGTPSVSNAAPGAHTHSYYRTTSITLNAGTAPSMNFNTGVTTDTPYVATATDSSLALSSATDYTGGPYKSASNASATTTVAAHTHTHSYKKTSSITLNAGTAPTLTNSDTTSTGAISYLKSYAVSGGGWEVTTAKLKASISSYDTTAAVVATTATAVKAVTAINAGDVATRYFHPAFNGTADFVGPATTTTTVLDGLSGGGITDISTKYMTATFTGSSGDITAETTSKTDVAKYNHTHTVTPAGSVSLLNTANSGGIEFVSSIDQTQKYFKSDASSADPTDAGISVAAPDHTHSVTLSNVSVGLGLNDTAEGGTALITALSKTNSNS